MESKEFNSFLSTCYDRGKILIKDDGKNGGGKRGVGEIIHRPPKDLLFLNGHVEVIDGGTRREGDAVIFLSPRLRVSVSPYLSCLDCPDFLPHENEVANPKTDEGDGYDRDKIPYDDDKALQKGKGILKTTQRKPLQRPHQNEASGGLPCWIKNGGGCLIIKVRRGQKGDRSLNLFVFHQVCIRAALADRGHCIGHKTCPQADKKGEKNPDGKRSQGRSGCAPENDRKQDRYPQPERHVENTGDHIDRKTQYFF